MSQRTALTYAFDAYCGWCYGFGPAIRAFAAANGDRIELRVISGGLFSGTRAAPISDYPHIPDANARIAQLTGVTFGDGYLRTLREGSTVMDSTDAAAGLVALRGQDHTRALDAASAIQRAWYIDGRSLSDQEVYRDIAAALGLNADAVAKAYADPSTRAEAEGDFGEVRRLGVESYPTLLLPTSEGNRVLGGPTSTAQELTQALDECMGSASA